MWHSPLCVRLLAFLSQPLASQLSAFRRLALPRFPPYYKASCSPLVLLPFPLLEVHVLHHSLSESYSLYPRRRPIDSSAFSPTSIISSPSLWNSDFFSLSLSLSLLSLSLSLAHLNLRSCCNSLSVFPQMWHKAVWIGCPMRLELAREGLFV